MTVKDLIEKLERVEPTSDVYTSISARDLDNDIADPIAFVGTDHSGNVILLTTEVLPTIAKML